MGNYKSRPPSSCADELKKKISEGYAVLRSRLNDDLKSRTESWTAFQVACFQGTLENVEELFVQSSLDERTDTRQLSLLHLVCAGAISQQKSKIEYLIEKCGDDDAKRRSLLSHMTRNGFSALHLALYKCEVASVSALLAAGADANLCGPYMLPPLHVAAMCGNADNIDQLIQAGASLHAVDWVNFTALHCATYFGHEKIVKMLLSQGADPNHCGGVKDRPLHLASSKGSLGITTSLLDAGADPALTDEEGNSSLHFAAKAGHASIVELLLRRSQKNGEHQLAMKTNVYGDTPLHVACYAGKLDSAKRLLTIAGTHCLNTENLFSEPPLHAACTNGKNIELVAYLLKQPGVDANYQGQDGHTALHSACYHGHLRLVQYLLESGADQSLTARAVVDYPLSPAVAGSSGGGGYGGAGIGLNGPMFALTRPESAGSIGSSKSSTLSLADDQQQTPIIWAYERGHDQIVALLKQYANRRPDSDVCSEYSSGDSSYTPLPSPLGKLRSMTKEKAEILQLRGALKNCFHLSLADVDFQEAIGSGSFGKVYKGTYRGRIVAIKRYRALAFGAKSEVDMFCREVSILCKLSNTNVISFLGACLDDPSQFAIITEYVSNGSLFSLLHEQKRVLEMSLRLSVGVDVARGMRYLHELPVQPVIHRDLNSHNILLHDTGRAVVADFGESRFLVQHDDDNMTKQPGNLRWMAPEIFTQCGRYDRKADVFSFALCVWEVHAAELPFAHLKPAAAAAEMAYKRSRPPLPSGGEGSPQFPRHIVQLVTTAWQAEAHLRPDFADIVPVLEAHVNESIDQLDQNSNCDPSGLPSSSFFDCAAALEHHRSSSSVSALKTQWEQRSVTPTRPQAASSSVVGLNLAAAANASRNVDELRQRLDRNGYVLQPKNA